MGSETIDYYLWTVVLVLMCTKMTVSKDLSEYLTIYACDGKMLKIECKENHVINLIRANYGRYSITVCNDNGSTDWSVNCMSPKSFSILQARCNSKQNCSIAASTSLFEDPCPGTMKYLEAQYACVSATISSSTSRANPPWLITSPPNIWMISKSFAIHSETSTVTSSPTTSATIATPSSSTVAVPKEKDLSEVDPPIPVIPSPSVDPEVPILHVDDEFSNSTASVQDDNNKEPMCKPTVIRNLTWNWKSGGEVYVQPCPGGATGLAQWRCLKISTDLAVWFPDTPDLSECRSMWLNSLESRIDKGDSLITIAEDLSQVTENKILFGGDLLTTVKIIHDLAQKMQSNVRIFSDVRQKEAMVYELLLNVVKVSNNLLDVSKRASWKDLSYKEQMQVASSLLIGLEENAFLLAESTTQHKVEMYCLKNIFLSVQVLDILDMKNVHNELLTTFFISDSCSLKVDGWLQLHKSSLLENNEANMVRLVYIAFDTLQHVLKVQPHEKVEKIINSKVVSASLGEGKHIQLTQPVTLCLRHLQLENVSNPVCVFWDYTQNQWSDEGCSLISTNETHTICRCSHLTNFAIMVDVQPTSDYSISILILCLVAVILLILLVSTLLILIYQYRQRLPKEYDSAAFTPENGKWFCKYFGCCLASNKSEKTFSCKEPRPSLYGNATMQSMASVVDDSGAIHATHVIPHTSSTISRLYMPENTIEGHYSTSHLRLNHHYPTYSRNGSLRKMREARRLEHLENTLQHRNKKLAAGSLRSSSSHSHTYSEIAATSQRSDPVYEEIEREQEHFNQVSDVSDEEARRISDTSRQSSKSYGDHRPLIPSNPVTDRNFHAALDAAYRQQLMEHNARTISVLDGQTVVCHMQQSDPRIYHRSMSHSPHHY